MVWAEPREPLLAATPTPKTTEWHANFSAWGALLYWKTAVNNWPYAVVATIDTLSVGLQLVNHESPKEMRFRYDPGFRVGLAGNFGKGWDLLAQYTRFHTSAHTSKTVADPGIIFALWDFALPARTNMLSAHQSLKLSQVNLDFIRNFSWGKAGSIDPFFGAVGAVIDQQLFITANQLFDPPSTGIVKTDLRNDFRGGGLEAGLAINYTPARWFTLCGKGSYALLYGNFKLTSHSKDTVSLPPEISFAHDQKAHEWAVVNAFDVTAGVKLNWTFSHSCLTAYADYEFVFWPAQVRIPRIRSDISTKTLVVDLNNSRGDVGFHGATVGLMLRF
jgi:hypothetical protein